MEDEKLKEFINGIIEKKVKPFFKEYLPTLYDENLEIIVDFKDNAEDVKIGADKNTNKISFHVAEKIEDFQNIEKQEINFGDMLRDDSLKHKINIPREDAYAILLIHEFAHKYHWNLMKENNSYSSLKSIDNKYFFPAIKNLKSIAMKMNIKNPTDVFVFLEGLDEKNIPENIKEEMEFLAQEIDGVKFTDFAADKFKVTNNLGIDVDETFAKSVERIYTENANLSPEVKKAILTFRQDWFENHPIIETQDAESKTSKTYADEVFYRLYEKVGKENFMNYLKDVNYAEIAKLSKNNRDGSYSEKYIGFLQNHEQFLGEIGRDDKNKSPMEYMRDIFLSLEAKEIGVDSSKYDETRNNNDSTIYDEEKSGLQSIAESDEALNVFNKVYEEIKDNIKAKSQDIENDKEQHD